ncbi:MAG TPA: hypothetical protein VF711_02300 [Acidimicrobiales bacterium]
MAHLVQAITVKDGVIAYYVFAQAAADLDNGGALVPMDQFKLVSRGGHSLRDRSPNEH